MTLTAAAGTDQLEKRRRYRRLMVASIVLGSLGLIVAGRFDQHVLGVAVYWAGVFAFLAIWRGTSVPIFDERDADLERRAGQLTLLVAAAVGIVGVPLAVTLDRLGYVALSPVVEGVIYGYAGLFVLFGVIYGWLRFRP